MLSKFKLIFILGFIAIASPHYLVAQQIKESEVPAQIKKVGMEHSDNQPITMWVKDPKRGKYIASILNVDLMRNIEISFDGKLIKTSDALTENKLPIKVKAVLTERYLSKGMRGRNYLLIKEPKKGKYYSAELVSDDANYHVTLDEAGNVLNAEAQ